MRTMKRTLKYYTEKLTTSVLGRAIQKEKTGFIKRNEVIAYKTQSERRPQGLLAVARQQGGVRPESVLMMMAHPDKG